MKINYFKKFGIAFLLISIIFLLTACVRENPLLVGNYAFTMSYDLTDLTTLSCAEYYSNNVHISAFKSRCDAWTAYEYHELYMNELIPSNTTLADLRSTAFWKTVLKNQRKNAYLHN